MTPPITHFAVVYFTGDPLKEHPDPELRGRSPSIELIAVGSDEEFCWDALYRWTKIQPLRAGEHATVVMNVTEYRQIAD